jgi:uncharacterized protein (TIGR02246 family)
MSRADIAAVNHAIEDAVRNQNAEAVAACYTDDAIVMPPDAPFVKGRGAISQFWAAAFKQMGLRSLELRTLDLEIAGDAASEVGEAVLSLASGSATAKYVVVWKHAGGAWRLHRDIWNMKTG